MCLVLWSRKLLFLLLNASKLEQHGKQTTRWADDWFPKLLGEILNSCFEGKNPNISNSSPVQVMNRRHLIRGFVFAVCLQMDEVWGTNTLRTTRTTWVRRLRELEQIQAEKWSRPAAECCFSDRIQFQQRSGLRQA